MTLTVQIQFAHKSSLEDIFSICQQEVNTPNWVIPEKKEKRISNPAAVGADCWMECKELEIGKYELVLDIPYFSAHKMYGIANRVLEALNVKEFQAFDEFNDIWHYCSLDFLAKECDDTKLMSGLPVAWSVI